MAVSFLRLTPSDFWNMAPRTLLAMIDEYNDIKKCEWTMERHINSGGKVELERDKRKKQEDTARYVDPFLM
jgi:hypothetical protein